MIVKLDYNETFDNFINDSNSKMLGYLYVAIDEQRNNPDKNIPVQIRNGAEDAARKNTEPMQDILGIIINKPDITYDNASIEDVKTLADCIFAQNSPYTFKDDVNEQNYKMILGHIAGKLAVDLAAKHYEHNDGVGTKQYHFPIGIVQAKTDEPLVFDSSDYTKKPEKPSLNIFKYIFSSQYRHNYKLQKSFYNDSLTFYEDMINRTDRTMRLSTDCSNRFRHHSIIDGSHMQTQTMETAKLGILMQSDSLDRAEEQLGTSTKSEENENTRTLVEGGVDALSREELGNTQERNTQAVKNSPEKNKDMSMSN